MAAITMPAGGFRGKGSAFGGIVVTGDAQLDANLRSLGDKIAKRISKQAVGIGMTVVLRAVKSEAAKIGGGSSLKKSVGKRFSRQRGNKNIREGKVGIHVGKAKQTKGQKKAGKASTFFKLHASAPHAHLVALGTGPRWRDRKGIGGKFSYLRGSTASTYTGMAEPKPYVIDGWRKSKATALSAINKAVRAKVKAEVAKLRV